MKKLFKRFIMTVGFFTTIRVPFIEWNEEDNKYMPIFIPLIGVVIALFLYVVILLIDYLNFSSLFGSMLIVVFFIFITGGLHLDAFMDTCDAHFSRRDIPKKLLIMKDSNIGAFAAVYLFVLLCSKLVIINEIIIQNKLTLVILLIPIISRLFQSILLLNTKFAKEDSLASMYGKLNKKYQVYFILYFILVVTFGFIINQIYITIFMILIALIYLFIYRKFALKQFGGITGDIIGAYIEITEVLLFLGVLIYDFLPLW
ncbi:adenosylcobinamide-GDP ribazoletransferase [Mycoplasmatota bacterium]|nr:adenosylcobinamide-GDP ribazoletransferase [Mycoplasmatota bacterium]